MWRRLRNLSVLNLVLEVWGLTSIFKDQKAHSVWADPSLLSGNKCLGRMPAPLSVMIILSGLILDSLHSSLTCYFTEQRWWTWTSTCLQELHKTICSVIFQISFFLFLKYVAAAMKKLHLGFFRSLATCHQNMQLDKICKYRHLRYSTWNTQDQIIENFWNKQNFH